MRQASNQTGTGTDEPILHRRERITDNAPLGRQDGGIPGVVNVAERGLQLRSQRLVDAKQFFPPVSRWRYGCVIAMVGIAGIKFWQIRIDVRQIEVATR